MSKDILAEIGQEVDDELDETQYATLADLCEGAQFEDKFFPQLGKAGATIRYRKFMPLEKLLQLQAKHGMFAGRGRRDSRGFMLAVLEEVLVRPRIQTPDERRLLLKGNATVLLDIIGEVLGTEEESFKIVREDLGKQ